MGREKRRIWGLKTNYVEGGGGGGIPNNGPYESRNGADSEYRLFPSFHVNISTAPNRAAGYVSKNMISQRCHNDEAHLPI